MMDRAKVECAALEERAKIPTLVSAWVSMVTDLRLATEENARLTKLANELAQAVIDAEDFVATGNFTPQARADAICR